MSVQGDFNATYVAVEEDAAMWEVAFTDAEFNARRRLALQRDRAPSAADTELGLDGYRVELDDESCYGGIESCELYRDRVEVRFDDDALEGIEPDEPVIVRFSLRDRQFAALRGCLAAIFAADGCFFDAEAGR